MARMQAQAIHDPFQLFLETAANIYSDSFLYMNAYNRDEVPSASQGNWVRFYAWDLHKEPRREITLGDNGRVGGELQHSILRVVNYHHNWLLVSAYEGLDRFLKDIFAGIGLHEPSYWRGSDLNGVDLSAMDLPAIKKRVRCTIGRQGTKEIMNHIRHVFQLNDGCRNNSQESLAACSPRFWRGVAEVFRHHIVHSEGRFYGPEERFFNKASEATGESFIGCSDSVVNNRKQFKRFLHGLDSEVTEIWTVDQSLLRSKAPGAHAPFRFLMTGITTFALLVYSCICDKLDIERSSIFSS